MTDETDDEQTDDSDAEFGTMFDGGVSGSMFTSLFGGTAFDADGSMGVDEGYEVAIKLLKAGSALEEFADFVEDNDIDMVGLEQSGIQDLDPEEQAVVYSFISISSSFQTIEDTMTEDDDDSNPFKVSDGDDPVY